MARYLVLFGAGASHGSDSIGTPPLTAGVFDALARFNPPGWGQLPTSSVTTFRQDFEKGMEQLSVSNPHMMPPLQRAMAAYFFNFVPRTQNLYVQIAARLRQRAWDGALATLNYERLLELALISQGVQPVVGTAPSVLGQVEMCLPHGTCHLFCESVVQAVPGMVSMSGVDVTTNGPIVAVPDPAQYVARVQGHAFPPVMSYFEPQKRTMSGGTFIDGQRTRLTQLISQATITVIVGVRLRPWDKHLWTPLAAAPGRIVYCSGPSAGREFQQWASDHARRNDTVLNEYFADAFPMLMASLDLA